METSRRPWCQGGTNRKETMNTKPTTSANLSGEEGTWQSAARRIESIVAANPQSMSIVDDRIVVIGGGSIAFDDAVSLEMVNPADTSACTGWLGGDGPWADQPGHNAPEASR